MEVLPPPPPFSGGTTFFRTTILMQSHVFPLCVPILPARVQPLIPGPIAFFLLPTGLRKDDGRSVNKWQDRRTSPELLNTRSELPQTVRFMVSFFSPQGETVLFLSVLISPPGLFSLLPWAVAAFFCRRKFPRTVSGSRVFFAPEGRYLFLSLSASFSGPLRALGPDCFFLTQDREAPLQTTSSPNPSTAEQLQGGILATALHTWGGGRGSWDQHRVQNWGGGVMESFCAPQGFVGRLLLGEKGQGGS